MLSQSIDIPQRTANALYVPVHRRSPSVTSSSGSHGGSKSWTIDDSSSTARPISKQLIYSIPELLRLSSSPLVQLSPRQLDAIHENLYNPLSRDRSPPPRPHDVRKPVVSIPEAVVIESALATQSTQRSRKRTRRNNGHPRDSGNKGRGISWVHEAHAVGVQNDWRHPEVPVYGVCH